MDQINKRVFPETLQAFCIDAMVKAGMERDDARITAEVLVTTDTWGVHTHGTKQVRGLMKNYRDGRMDLHAKPELLREGPGWALLDGHRAMAMVSSVRAMELAIDKARATGIAYTAVRNSGHYGAAGYYANMAVAVDMIGMSMTNVDVAMAVPGARAAVLGTNPLAYAVPAGQEPPILMDIATSVVAASKVFAAQDLNQPIPSNWLLDKDGLPTTNPTGYPAVGALMPMAAHKGYGIALMIEILTGLLAGGAMGKEITSWVLDTATPVNQSHCFLAVNIGAIMPVDNFKQRMDTLIRQIKNAPKARDAERIFLPGEKEWEYRAKALREGMVLPEHVLVRLRGLAEDYHLDINAIFDGTGCAE